MRPLPSLWRVCASVSSPSPSRGCRNGAWKVREICLQLAECRVQGCSLRPSPSQVQPSCAGMQLFLVVSVLLAAELLSSLCWCQLQQLNLSSKGSSQKLTGTREVQHLEWTGQLGLLM